MKKVILATLVAVAFTAYGGGETEVKEGADSTATATPPVEEPVVEEPVVEEVDTTAAVEEVAPAE